MQREKEHANDTSNRELKITRLFNAPINLVWEVWTRPEHIENWYGPNGFTLTTHKMNFKTAGEWEFIMHGPDCTDYLNKNIFVEISEPNKIVYDHLEDPIHRTTVTFEEQGNKTLMNFHMLFESSALKEETVKIYKADEGLIQTVSRLDHYVSRILSLQK